MNEPNWAKILHVMYEEGMVIRGGLRNGNRPEKIEEKTDLSQTEVWDALHYLYAMGLIRMDSGGFVDLTSPGFEVAYEKEQARQRQKTDDQIAFFTVILGLATIIQTAAVATSLEDNLNSIVLLLITGALAFSVLLSDYSSLKHLKSAAWDYLRKISN